MSHEPQGFREDRTGEVMSGVEIFGPDAPAPAAVSAVPPRPRDRWESLGSGRSPVVSPRRRRVPVKPLRRPLLALPALVVLALAAAFFAWVSAGPFWLSLGHQVSGTVTVLGCEPTGMARQCVGDFRPSDGTPMSRGVRVTGDTTTDRVGETVAAQAIPDDPSTVYVGGDAGLFLRWLLGLGLALACGLGIAGATGAWRWRGRERAATVLACLAGPVLLWFGALVGTW